MKFSCDRVALSAAAATAARATSAKSPVPALEGLFIEAGDGIVGITGYDLKTGIVSQTEADVTEKGSIVLPARLFCDMIRKMEGDDVHITGGVGQRVSIECATISYDIVGSSPADYPSLPPMEGDDTLVINAQTLRDMISQTIFAVADSESRPVYTGMLFKVEDEIITAVALDTFRLALRRERVENAADMSFIVPGSALSEMERILSADGGDVTIIAGAKHVIFKSSGATLISRRLEGEFFDYKTSIQTGKYTVVADRRVFVSALERVSLIIDEKAKSPVRCTFGDGIVTLKSMSAIGTANDEFAVTGDGDNMELGVNSKYLLDALRAAPSDKVKLMLSGTKSACSIVPEGDDDYFLYMVMPVRLSSDV